MTSLRCVCLATSLTLPLLCSSLLQASEADAAQTENAKQYLDSVHTSLDGCIREIQAQCKPFDYETRAAFREACEAVKLAGVLQQCDAYVANQQSTQPVALFVRSKVNDAAQQNSELPDWMAERVGKIKSKAGYAHALMTGMHYRSFIADPDSDASLKEQYSQCVLAAGEQDDPSAALAECKTKF